MPSNGTSVLGELNSEADHLYPEPGVAGSPARSVEAEKATMASAPRRETPDRL